MRFLQKKILRIGRVEKLRFFYMPFWIFFFYKKPLFLLHPHENQSQIMWYNGTQFWCFSWFPANSLLCVILHYTVYIRRKHKKTIPFLLTVLLPIPLFTLILCSLYWTADEIIKGSKLLLCVPKISLLGWKMPSHSLLSSFLALKSLINKVSQSN